MARKRLPFRPSPDKGRTGGVCGSGISFLHDLPPENPPQSPLVRGEVGHEAVIMARKRLPFCPSPDKGRTGGVCGSGISFLHDLPPKNPPQSPLVRGEVGHKAVIMARKRLPFRPSPDKGRTGGVCSGEMGFFV
jgi:hypothetical protein